MDRNELMAAYEGYIACLNRQDWERLDYFVHDDVEHNGNLVALKGYRATLERDFSAIPDWPSIQLS